jgi:hypothetical protein
MVIMKRRNTIQLAAAHQHLDHVSHQIIRGLPRTGPPRSHDHARPTRIPSARPRRGPTGPRAPPPSSRLAGHTEDERALGVARSRRTRSRPRPRPTRRACPAHHAITRPDCASRSGRWSCEDTRTYTTVRPDTSPTDTSTTIVPNGTRRAGTGIRPSLNHR